MTPISVSPACTMPEETIWPGTIRCAIASCAKWSAVAGGVRKGEEAGSAPLGRLGGVRPPLRWEHGRPPDNVNAQCGLISGKLAGWRVGDARVLTRSRGFAAADPGGRLHLPASVIEVHVAARRLRRIVPLGIRPNGTIPFRGGGRLRARPDPPGRRRAFLLCAKR